VFGLGKWKWKERKSEKWDDFANFSSLLFYWEEKNEIKNINIKWHKYI